LTKTSIGVTHAQNMPDDLCIACGKKKKHSFDIRDKQQLRRIEANLTHPVDLLNKVVNAIRFQELHDKKYLEELEKRIGRLQLDNTNLKA